MTGRATPDRAAERGRVEEQIAFHEKWLRTNEEYAEVLRVQIARLKYVLSKMEATRS